MNLNEVLGSFTSQITATVATKAKDSVITTLKDPELKATINQFTKEWFNENKVIIIAVFGSCLLLSILAIVNILSDFRSR